LLIQFFLTSFRYAEYTRRTLKVQQIIRSQPMPRVTVTKADVSTKGKPRVYFDNKHNWQDAVYIGNSCGAAPVVGQVIDADTSSQRFQNARSDTWFLNRWTAATQPPSQQGPFLTDKNGHLIVHTETMVNKLKQGWPDLPTGDMLRWVSNVVGSAIAANLIKTPSDIAQWVGASYRAAESLRSGDVPEFDSDVPRFVEPDPAAEQQQGGGEEEFEGDASIPF
jgi:hypothetical protein